MKSKSVVKMGPRSPIWTINDLSEYLGVSVWTIMRGYKNSARRNGELDFTKLYRCRVGGMWRWFSEEVRSWARGLDCGTGVIDGAHGHCENRGPRVKRAHPEFVVPGPHAAMPRGCEFSMEGIA